MTMNNLRVNGERLWQSIMAMAEIGATAKGGSCRLALTDEDKAGRDLFVGWCRDAGCDVSVDSMGNIFARRAGSAAADAAAVGIGSHLDTQPHGGKFDGIFGVLAGLEVIRTLNDNAVQTAAPIEVINWTNEEGSRFAPAMLASGVFAGVFEAEYALSRPAADGVTFGDELARIGYAGAEVCGRHPLRAFLEAHIEQGPILERAGETIGVVTGGQGQRWFDVTVRGQDSHAGSTPMPGRRDALVAAAHAVLAVQAIACDSRFAPHAVGTVGEMYVTPNSRNTIPGEVWFSVDFRHPDDAALAAMAAAFVKRAEEIGGDGVAVQAKEIWHNPPVRFDAACVDAVQAAAEFYGYRNRRMVSGAGHDACQLTRIVPTAMVFVPCEGGLSHNEEESAEPGDLEAGANVLLQAAVRLAGV